MFPLSVELSWASVGLPQSPVNWAAVGGWNFRKNWNPMQKITLSRNVGRFFLGSAAKWIAYVLVRSTEVKLTLEFGAAVRNLCCRVVENAFRAAVQQNDLVLAWVALLDLCVASGELVGVLQAGLGETDAGVEETSVRNRDT